MREMADSDIAPAAPGDGGAEGAVEPMDTSGENETPRAEDGGALISLHAAVAFPHISLT